MRGEEPHPTRGAPVTIAEHGGSRGAYPDKKPNTSVGDHRCWDRLPDRRGFPAIGYGPTQLKHRVSTAVHQYSHVKRFHAQGIRHSIAFAHPTKSFGDRQEVYRDRISEIWKSLVSNRHDRRQSTIQSSHSWTGTEE